MMTSFRERVIWKGENFALSSFLKDEMQSRYIVIMNKKSWREMSRYLNPVVGSNLFKMEFLTLPPTLLILLLFILRKDYFPQLLRPDILKLFLITSSLFIA